MWGLSPDRLPLAAALTKLARAQRVLARHGHAHLSLGHMSLRDPEGRGFWLYKVAPISARKLLLGKLALAYLPFPTIGALFVILLSVLQGSTPGDFARSLALVLIGGLGTTSITLGLGAAFPKFNWENPRQQNSVQAGCLAPIAYLLYLAIALAAVIGLPAAGALLPDYGVTLAVAGWAIFAGLTALAVWGSLAFGSARLEQLEIA